MDAGEEHSHGRNRGAGAIEPTGHARDARKVPVRDLMERKVVRISADDRLATVQDLFTLGGVRHLPVVEAGRLVGVVSERDLLRASLSSISDFGADHRRAFLHSVEIRRVMSSPAIVATPGMPVGRAARLMADRKIGCLPVVDENEKLVGIVTETDLLRFFAGAVPESVEIDLGSL